jgi:cathepsin B
MMKYAVVLSALVAAAAAVPAVPENEDRQAVIDHINSLPNHPWKAGSNARFLGKPLGWSKTLCGAKSLSDPEAVAQLAAENPAQLAFLQEAAKPENLAYPTRTLTEPLADSFDSREQWPKCTTIGDIRDQSDCGCCWAFATAEASSDRACITTDGEINLPLSADDMCFCAKSAGNGCNGGFPLGAFQFAGEDGLVSGGQNGDTTGYCSNFALAHCDHHSTGQYKPCPELYPSGGPPASATKCPKKCDDTAKAPHSDFESDKYSFEGKAKSIASSPEEIMAAIQQGGPVAAAFTVYSDFEAYKSGVYTHTSGQALGGHAVKIVGWGEDNGTDYWLVANSWNEDWGEKGLFRIKKGNDECGIESSTSMPDGKWSKKDSEPAVTAI